MTKNNRKQKRQKTSTKKNSTRVRGFFGKKVSITMPQSAEYFRQYYIDNKEDFQERYKRYSKSAAWRAKTAENHKKYYQENKDVILKKQKKIDLAKKRTDAQIQHTQKLQKDRYERIKEAKKAQSKLWYENNKDKVKEARFMRKYRDVISEFILSLEEF